MDSLTPHAREGTFPATLERVTVREETFCSRSGQTPSSHELPRSYFLLTPQQGNECRPMLVIRQEKGG